MRIFSSFVIAGALSLAACSPPAEQANTTQEAQALTERNKEIAPQFYKDLWFTNNTNAYSDYVADEYVVHDLGERKGVIEQAGAQKEIADLFHSFGAMSGEIDYQIAEGDKVATRWFVNLAPNEQAEAMGFPAVERVAIINVFRFNDEGKIVEIWNHRHDPELPQPPQG